MDESKAQRSSADLLSREGPRGERDAPASAGRDTAPKRAPLVYVTDGAAEGARVADTLRTGGYAVVDVPLATLVGRVEVERPHVILADVDAEGALGEILRLRKIPGGAAIDFVYVGSGLGPIKSTDEAMANDGSAFFLRPVDLGALLRRLESLTGGPVDRPSKSAPPPSFSLGRRGSAPPDRSSTPSLPAPGLRTPGPPLPMSTPSLADLVDPPRASFATFGTVSNELQQLLAEAELRADIQDHPRAELPTPEEEIEAVLPAEVLASLDEPIGGDEDEEQDVRAGTGVGTGPGHDREGTGAHAKGTTSGGSRLTTSGGRTPHTHERRLGSDHPTRETITNQRPSEFPMPPPARIDEVGRIPDSRQLTQPRLPKSFADLVPATDREVDARREPLPRRERQAFPEPVVRDPAARREPIDSRADRQEATRFEEGPPTSDRRTAPTSRPLPRPDSVTIATVDAKGPGPASLAMAPESPVRGPSGEPPRPSSTGTVIPRPLDARRFFADAVSQRLTGALCFEHGTVVRRLVLRDGDLVTAASGKEQESLVCFLGGRGDLPKDEVERMAGKVPPYGRHAGAALVAHGWLGQDQLWSALRAHAEWIATAVLRLSNGIAQLESEPPGRLRSEPSVFGASTGPEIFVELVRRAVSPEEAIDALGGEGCRISEGVSYTLLGECALPPADLELVSRSRGATLGDLLLRGADTDIAAVVHGLTLLNVLDVVPAVEPVRPITSTSNVSAEVIALDDEAVRARVRARLELVDEGDYFSVLGVARDATSYEVRRAFVELRRSFEPTRLLSPRLVDLREDVDKIVVVLEEAYEILRDVARRERYRRAIDARP